MSILFIIKIETHAKRSLLTQPDQLCWSSLCLQRLGVIRELKKCAETWGMEKSGPWQVCYLKKSFVFEAVSYMYHFNLLNNKRIQLIYFGANDIYFYLSRLS